LVFTEEFSVSASPLIRFIDRHQDRWDGPVLWLYPSDLEATVHGVQPDRGDRVWVEDCRFLPPLALAGIDAEIGLQLEGLQDAAHIVVQFPRSKAWFDAIIQCARRAAPTADIWVIGHNRSGVKSAADIMQSALPEVEEDDHARHCVMVHGTPAGPDAGADWPPSPSTWTDPALGKLSIISLPGVFSHGRLDEGTRLLLAELPPLKGDVLDMACGAGVLAAHAASAGARVMACDASLLAVESTRATLKENGLSGRVFLSDGFAAVEGTFNTILCNPPFHRGSEVDTEAASAMLHDAALYLKPGGELWVVANAFLPYQSILDAAFSNVRTVANDGKFRVYCAHSPKARS
jgi:16S rRNA (guanine1207-N2)-methyltransferase